MYTECPECGTVFRVTADALRVAQGLVRCGICSASFSALDSLRDAPRPGADDALPEDTITVEELPGESIELSSTDTEAASDPAPAAEPADEDSPLESGAPGDPAEAGLVLFEEDRPGEPDEFAADAPAEELLEFRGSAEDLDRVFVLDTTPRAAPPLAWTTPAQAEAGSLEEALERAARADLSGIEVREEPAAQVGAPEAFPAETLEATDEFPILVLDEREAAAATQEEPQAFPPEEPEPPRFLIPPEMRRDLEAEADGVEIASRDLLGLPGDASPGEAAEDPARRWPWVAAATVLLAAAGTQAVHHWRDDLARSPVAGPWILRAYDALGIALDPPTDLAAFELRQWGATSDASAADRLRLRASIVNRAVFAQPYPLLRLSLQDRFGNTIATRDVAAADYLPGAASGTPRLLAPGQRADAEIVFVDPGRDAVGFELDLCVPAGAGLRCANAPPGDAP